ncbi:MAG: hypothetical protein AYP45_10810 [Candidatus Brocadia carolinensis]|uniref:Uncharacterized protein n=1 Tax=Candidatus Brocadia carolinensis TaxID=1004156 RepID=A0A1V4ASN7_9BACT|nr:MAG: hypothetical protein AYP45_10810 [Candidatus Brocadia caroliniensis]
MDVSVSPLTETRINPRHRDESGVIDSGFRREDTPKHQRIIATTRPLLCPAQKLSSSKFTKGEFE